jgi:hypothetical protein
MFHPLAFIYQLACVGGQVSSLPYSVAAQGCSGRPHGLVGGLCLGTGHSESIFSDKWHTTPKCISFYFKFAYLFLTSITLA